MNSFKPPACSPLTARPVQGLELGDGNDGSGLTTETLASTVNTVNTHRDSRSRNISWSGQACQGRETGGCVESGGCHTPGFSSSVGSHRAHCRPTRSSRRTNRQKLERKNTVRHLQYSGQQVRRGGRNNQPTHGIISACEYQVAQDKYLNPNRGTFITLNVCNRGGQRGSGKHTSTDYNTD